MDELIAKISKIPPIQRIAAMAGIALALFGLNYFFYVSDAQGNIENYEKRARQLEASLIQKRQIARDLARYRVEVERLKQRLNEALTLLPNDAEIPELLQKLSALVEQSDCELSRFEPQPEVVEGFYARIPVRMSISGNFHSIAVFFDKVAKLTRIVNVTDISLLDPKLENKKIVLKAEFVATTFKFVEKAAPKSSTAGKGFN